MSKNPFDQLLCNGDPGVLSTDSHWILLMDVFLLFFYVDSGNPDQVRDTHHSPFPQIGFLSAQARSDPRFGFSTVPDPLGSKDEKLRQMRCRAWSTMRVSPARLTDGTQTFSSRYPPTRLTEKLLFSQLHHQKHLK